MKYNTTTLNAIGFNAPTAVYFAWNYVSQSIRQFGGEANIFWSDKTNSWLGLDEADEYFSHSSKLVQNAHKYFNRFYNQDKDKSKGFETFNERCDMTLNGNHLKVKGHGHPESFEYDPRETTLIIEPWILAYCIDKQLPAATYVLLTYINAACKYRGDDLIGTNETLKRDIRFDDISQEKFDRVLSALEKIGILKIEPFGPSFKYEVVMPEEYHKNDPLSQW